MVVPSASGGSRLVPGPRNRATLRAGPAPGCSSRHLVAPGRSPCGPRRLLGFEYPGGWRLSMAGRLFVVTGRLLVTWRLWSVVQFGSRGPGVCGKSPEVRAFAVPRWARGKSVMRSSLWGTAALHPGEGGSGVAFERRSVAGDHTQCCPGLRRTARVFMVPVLRNPGPARRGVFPVLYGRMWVGQSAEPRYSTYLGSALFLCPVVLTCRCR
ncbi:hypothetical protein RCH07_002204 [Arthrobacter sp. CG_A4]|nr:hypothetical protein [Arthrobacter sp. CG_A4]